MEKGLQRQPRLLPPFHLSAFLKNYISSKLEKLFDIKLEMTATVPPLGRYQILPVHIKLFELLEDFFIFFHLLPLLLFSFPISPSPLGPPLNF